ncbi:MAG: GNAT family N-acetyltransferase [Xanthobacteraceae bacterium]
MEIANYFSEETLPNESRIIIRALRPDDRNDLMAVVGQVSNQSLYRRFFGPRRHFTKAEISFFVNVDFSRHVALIALLEGQSKSTIVGGARYVAETQQQAEVALMVIDEYQGQGIGGLLLRHLIAIARARGLQEFVAMVLPDNAAMLKVFRSCGIPATVTRESGEMHVTLQLD